jgi:hypothetical protein
MALFVLGAGATRGASFVKPETNPCLPPLDADFYAQLQRISNSKHRDTVREVIKNTVRLFGVNFKVTMETVFTTLEHTARMVETTGDSRDFKHEELLRQKETLMQAIAATLEESLCPKNKSKGKRYEGQECKHHTKLVSMMKPGDAIVTFNYDCLIDETLRRQGKGKWNPRYGYGLNLGKGGGNLVGYEEWTPENPPKERGETISVYKLHGSLHFLVKGEKVHLKERPYTRQHGNMRFSIIPPESNKRYDESIFRRIWKQAGQALHRAEQLVVIGYSFPVTDSHSHALFRISVKNEGLRSLVLVNPDQEARRRAREVLKRGLGPRTRVVIFDKFNEFVAADRSLWE